MAQDLRPDLHVIAGLIEPGSSVLDIGCGDGALLAWLAAQRQVDGRGIEIDPAAVEQAIARGVAVIQGDVDTDLADFPDDAFDVVILSQSLQMMHAPDAVLREMLRLAPSAVVSVPNFGHWRNRLYLGLKGRMPVTSTLSYSWYETPNIHFCTITDFIELCDAIGITIDKRLMVTHEGRPARFRGKGRFANLLGEQGVFLLRRALHQ